MPLVVVARNPDVVVDGLLKDLVGALPEIVALALTCENPGGNLTAQDIEVWVQDFGPSDINTKDVEIIIWANLYPLRAAYLDGSRQYISDRVDALVNSWPAVRKVSGFVWILLQPASYGEF